jgi:hypothetical protein
MLPWVRTMMVFFHIWRPNCAVMACMICTGGGRAVGRWWWGGGGGARRVVAAWHTAGREAALWAEGTQLTHPLVQGLYAVQVQTVAVEHYIDGTASDVLGDALQRLLSTGRRQQVWGPCRQAGRQAGKRAGRRAGALPSLSANPRSSQATVQACPMRRRQQHSCTAPRTHHTARLASQPNEGTALKDACPRQLQPPGCRHPHHHRTYDGIQQRQQQRGRAAHPAPSPWPNAAHRTDPPPWPAPAPPPPARPQVSPFPPGHAGTREEHPGPGLPGAAGPAAGAGLLRRRPPVRTHHVVDGVAGLRVLQAAGVY